MRLIVLLVFLATPEALAQPDPASSSSRGQGPLDEIGELRLREAERDDCEKPIAQYNTCIDEQATAHATCLQRLRTNAEDLCKRGASVDGPFDLKQANESGLFCITTIQRCLKYEPVFDCVEWRIITPAAINPRAGTGEKVCVGYKLRAEPFPSSHPYAYRRGGAKCEVLADPDPESCLIGGEKNTFKNCVEDWMDGKGTWSVDLRLKFPLPRDIDFSVGGGYTFPNSDFKGFNEDCLKAAAIAIKTCSLPEQCRQYK